MKRLLFCVMVVAAAGSWAKTEIAEIRVDGQVESANVGATPVVSYKLTSDIPDSGEKFSSRLNIFMVGSNDSPSRSIMIDLEGTKRVKGFRYLPPQGQGAKGIITRYSFWAMMDGEWKRISEGEFSNIVNNPIWQSVSINPINSGLLRIDAESMNAGERAAYEDIEILTE